MSFYLHIVFVFVSAASSLSKSSEKCSGQEQVCQFPFFHSGELYFECSTEAPGGGQDLYGRCPTSFHNTETREASHEPSDWVVCDESCPLQRYLQNNELEENMKSLVEEFPHLAKLIYVGKSFLGQNIVGIQITRGAGEERQLMKPKVRYVGNMHGNEPIGREVLNHLAKYLVKGYGISDSITNLVNSTDITLIPTMNPDGFDRAKEGACLGADYETGRFNEGNKDLNRDFPTWREINRNTSSIYQNRQPETKVMMDLILSEPWVLSANFHDGAVVASYPYDDYRDNQIQRGIHKTPDHQFFKHLASTYATNHPTMMDQAVCPGWWFENGITNGADWYAIDGGMQDFNYHFSNDMEITLELSCCKYPRRYYLNREWEQNKESLLQYLEQVHRGIKGTVINSSGFSVSEASIIVENADGPLSKNIITSNRGEYWRLLLPGQYKVKAHKNVCSSEGVILQSETVNVTITEENPLVLQDLVIGRLVPCEDTPK